MKRYDHFGEEHSEGLWTRFENVEKVIAELLELNVIKTNDDGTLEITLLGRKVLSGIIKE